MNDFIHLKAYIFTVTLDFYFQFIIIVVYKLF